MQYDLRSAGQTQKNALPDAASMKLCIDNCLKCFNACTSLIPHCLTMGGAHADVGHIGLLTTCAAMCETSAKFMLFESELHTETCRVCAMICKQCADDCEQLDGADEEMRECAKVCRTCAESCGKMAAIH